jgi:hypothetical protein
MPIEIRSVAEVEPLIARVRAAADVTAQRLRDLTGDANDGLTVLRRLKFSEFGRHPVEDRDINLIEQVNQTWTYLVSLRALPFLFERHPEAGGFRLYVGTEGGTDIMSLVPHAVAAEGFAAVHPQSNRKLAKDLEKLARDCPEARARYVFFAAPNFRHERQVLLEKLPGIEVWGIDV